MSNTVTVEELIENIITLEPKNPHEVQLQFMNQISIKELFMFCMQFFNELSKYKYGDTNGNVDITTWSMDTIDYINKYYKSFGMKIDIKILEPTIENYHNIKFYEGRQYNKYPITHNTKLSDLYYVMNHKSNNMYYVISFDYLRKM